MVKKLKGARFATPVRTHRAHPGDGPGDDGADEQAVNLLVVHLTGIEDVVVHRSPFSLKGGGRAFLCGKVRRFEPRGVRVF